MPLVTTVIDDKSPLISYDPTWLPGTSSDDPLASNYYLGTFTINNVTNGFATLNFNGTAVWVYGANRQNHGNYMVQVDSATTWDYNGFNGNNVFQQSLFNISTLSQGMHTLKLTNTATGNLYVDIDMIMWQSEVGNTDDQLVPEVVQDTDSRFKYQEQAWDTTSSTLNFNLFDNGTGHATEMSNASVTFTFTVGFSSFKSVINGLWHAGCSAYGHAALTDLPGEALTIFGTSGPYNAPYSVRLDGGQTVTYNATNAYPTNYGVVIYHADNLGSGSHQIVLTNLPAVGSAQALSIDYAQLWTLNTTSTDSSNSTSLLHYTSNLSSGAIAGIVVAVVAAVLGAGAAIFFYRRWKAALSTQDGLYRLYTPQQRPPESSTVAATGFSSSLETRNNGTMLRNDASTQAFSGRAPGNNYAAQYDGAVPLSSGSRDSRGITDTVNSPNQSSVDEGLGRRPLPEAPGGGLTLSAEFPKLVGVRRGQSIGQSSIAMSDVPPDYSQAIGNLATSYA